MGFPCFYFSKELRKFFFFWCGPVVLEAVSWCWINVWITFSKIPCFPHKFLCWIVQNDFVLLKLSQVSHAFNIGKFGSLKWLWREFIWTPAITPGQRTHKKCHDEMTCICCDGWMEITSYFKHFSLFKINFKHDSILCKFASQFSRWLH